MTTTREADRAFMRGILAAYGMPLDAPSEPERPTSAMEPTAPAPVDRDEVRSLLVAAGAPERDLEWLIASCPSLDDARAYRPPKIYAWCVDCASEQPIDADGCQTCRVSTDT